MRNRGGFETLISDLAAAAVEAQRGLDAEYLIELRRVTADRDDLEVANPHIAGLLPPRMALDSLTVDAGLVLEERREIGGAIDLSILARPAHTFLWCRFALNERQTSRVTVEVRAAPFSDAGGLATSATADTDSARGTSRVD